MVHLNPKPREWQNQTHTHTHTHTTNLRVHNWTLGLERRNKSLMLLSTKSCLRHIPKSMGTTDIWPDVSVRSISDIQGKVQDVHEGVFSFLRQRCKILCPTRSLWVFKLGYHRIDQMHGSRRNSNQSAGILIFLHRVSMCVCACMWVLGWGPAIEALYLSLVLFLPPLELF